MTSRNAPLLPQDKLGSTIEGWLELFVASTRRVYRISINTYRYWLQQMGLDLDTARTNEVVDYTSYLKRKGFKAATINNRLEAIRGCYNYLFKASVCAFFEWPKVNMTLEHDIAPKSLKRNEWLTLKREAHDQIALADSRRVGGISGVYTPWAVQARRDYALIMLLGGAGLRIEEAATLKVADVQGKYIYVQGKGHKERNVPMNSAVRRALDDYLISIAGRSHNLYLFSETNGDTHISTDGLRKRVIAIGEKCNIKVTPHRLRHTFAKLLLEEKVDLVQIQIMLGHANLNVTARYTKPRLDELASSVEKLTELETPKG